MKFLFSIAILFITLSAMGQVDYYFFAGPQATSSSYTVNSVKQTNQIKAGFQAGAGLKIPFENKLSFAPTAFYSMKGYKVTFNQFTFPPDPDAQNNNTTIHTFETAALLQYDFSTEADHFFIKAGPSLDFQLMGTEKFDLKSGGSVDRNLKFSYGDYGHFSANMLAQLGYETTNGLMIFAHYTHGLASINNADYGPTIRHRVFGISIGKYLGTIKK